MTAHLLLVEYQDEDLSVTAVCPLPDGHQKGCATSELCGCDIPDDEYSEGYELALEAPCPHGGGEHLLFDGELHVSGTRCWLVHDAELLDGVTDFDVTLPAGTYEVRYTVEDGYALVIEDLTPVTADADETAS